MRLAPRPISTPARRAHVLLPPSRAVAPPTLSPGATSVAPFAVRPASATEFDAVAALRASAYYEDQPGGGGRFADSYKRQFREQEAASLAARTAPCAGGGPPEAECLAAVDDSAGVLLGALDVRPPACAGGGHPAGVPMTDPTGAAVLNVAVAPSARRRGVGRALLRGAAMTARAEWGAQTLYTSVAATNDAARALYADLGFGEVGDAVAAVAGATSLGRDILLRADAAAVADATCESD